MVCERRWLTAEILEYPLHNAILSDKDLPSPLSGAAVETKTLSYPLRLLLLHSSQWWWSGKMCKDATRDNHYFKGAHTSLGQVIMFVNGIIRESVDSSSFAGFQKFPPQTEQLTKGSTKIRIMLYSLFIALFSSESGRGTLWVFGLLHFRNKRCCSLVTLYSAWTNYNKRNTRFEEVEWRDKRDNPKAR